MNYAIQILTEQLARIRSYHKTLKTREEGAVKGDLEHIARYEVQIEELERGIFFINGCLAANDDLCAFCDALNLHTPVQTIPEPAIEQADKEEPE